MKNYIYYFLFLFIIIMSYINSLQNVEHFTPQIREMYRPILRNTRIISEGFYDKTISTSSNFLRKFGIM